MSVPDCINGAYEMMGGLFLAYNCFVLYKHKQVRGVSVAATIFFTTWSWWNLYYYPHLNQWMSFTGGYLIVITNSLWIAMMIHYIHREKKQKLLNNPTEPV